MAQNSSVPATPTAGRAAFSLPVTIQSFNAHHQPPLVLLRRDRDPAGEDELLAEQSVGGVALDPSLQRLPAALEPALEEPRWIDRVTHADLRQVTRASFHGVETIGNKELAQLRRCTGLKRLSLYRTSVTDEGMANLQAFTGLRALSLEHTAVTDAGLEHLAGLRRKSRFLCSLFSEWPTSLISGAFSPHGRHS